MCQITVYIWSSIHVLRCVGTTRIVLYNQITPHVSFLEMCSLSSQFNCGVREQRALHAQHQVKKLFLHLKCDDQLKTIFGGKEQALLALQNQSWAVTLRCWFGLSKEIVRSNPCSRLQSRNAPVNWITAFDLIKKPIRCCKTSFHPASRVAFNHCFAEPLVCYRPHLVGDVIHNQVISLGCKHFWCISGNSKVVYLGEGSLEKFAIQIKLSLTNHPRDTIAHTLGSLRLASQKCKDPQISTLQNPRGCVLSNSQDNFLSRRASSLPSMSEKLVATGRYPFCCTKSKSRDH